MYKSSPSSQNGIRMERRAPEPTPTLKNKPLALPRPPNSQAVIPKATPRPSTHVPPHASEKPKPRHPPMPTTSASSSSSSSSQRYSSSHTTPHHSRYEDRGPRPPYPGPSSKSPASSSRLPHPYPYPHGHHYPPNAKSHPVDPYYYPDARYPPGPPPPRSPKGYPPRGRYPDANSPGYRDYQEEFEERYAEDIGDYDDDEAYGDYEETEEDRNFIVDDDEEDEEEDDDGDNEDGDDDDDGDGPDYEDETSSELEARSGSENEQSERHRSRKRRRSPSPKPKKARELKRIRRRINSDDEDDEENDKHGSKSKSAESASPKAADANPEMDELDKELLDLAEANGREAPKDHSDTESETSKRRQSLKELGKKKRHRRDSPEVTPKSESEEERENGTGGDKDDDQEDQQNEIDEQNEEVTEDSRLLSQPARILTDPLKEYFQDSDTKASWNLGLYHCFNPKSLMYQWPDEQTAIRGNAWFQMAYEMYQSGLQAVSMANKNREININEIKLVFGQVFGVLVNAKGLYQSREPIPRDFRPDPDLIPNSYFQEDPHTPLMIIDREDSIHLLKTTMLKNQQALRLLDRMHWLHQMSGDNMRIGWIEFLKPKFMSFFNQVPALSVPSECLSDAMVNFYYGLQQMAFEKAHPDHVVKGRDKAGKSEDVQIEFMTKTPDISKELLPTLKRGLLFLMGLEAIELISTLVLSDEFRASDFLRQFPLGKMCFYHTANHFKNQKPKAGPKLVQQGSLFLYIPYYIQADYEEDREEVEANYQSQMREILRAAWTFLTENVFLAARVVKPLSKTPVLDADGMLRLSRGSSVEQGLSHLFGYFRAALKLACKKETIGQNQLSSARYLAAFLFSPELPQGRFDLKKTKGPFNKEQVTAFRENLNKVFEDTRTYVTENSKKTGEEACNMFENRAKRCLEIPAFKSACSIPLVSDLISQYHERSLASKDCVFSALYLIMGLAAMQAKIDLQLQEKAKEKPKASLIPDEISKEGSND